MNHQNETETRIKSCKVSFCPNAKGRSKEEGKVGEREDYRLAAYIKKISTWGQISHQISVERCPGDIYIRFDCMY